MKIRKDNKSLIAILIFFMMGFYYYTHSSSLDQGAEDKFVELSEQAITENFPSKEYLESANFSIYKNYKKISSETEKILFLVKHLRSFPLQNLLLNQSYSGQYTIGDEFKEGINNLRLLLSRSEKSVKKSEDIILHNLELYKNAYERLEFPADRSNEKQFEKVLLSFASIYPSIEGQEIERYILYIMADCAEKIKNMNYYMITPVLLTKVIRDNPKDELARKAWLRLNVYSREIFTGSSGEHTPKSWKILINDLAVIVAGN